MIGLIIPSSSFKLCFSSYSSFEASSTGQPSHTMASLIADTSFVSSASPNLSASFSFVSESRKSLPGPKSIDHKNLAVILTGEQFCVPTNLFEYLYVRIPMDAMLSNQTWLGVLQDNPQRSEEIKSKIHSKMRCITYKLLKELWDDTTY